MSPSLLSMKGSTNVAAKFLDFEMSMDLAPIAQHSTKANKSSLLFDTNNKDSSSTALSRLDKIANLQKNPIKLVDLNKLLYPKSDVKNMTSNHMNEDKDVKKFAALARPSDLSLVTLSHVLSCFKEMLPSKFDLSRLIPNEKLTTLVIRYLKLNSDDASQSLVKDYLQIIIDASKATDSTFGDHSKHPYLNIEDDALQAALDKVLPRDFSMVDVTNQILQCLCVVLNIGVHSDGFHFLRTQIRNFTAEGQQFNQIMNQTCARECRSSIPKDTEVTTDLTSKLPSKLITTDQTSKLSSKPILQTKNYQHCPPSNKGPKIKNWPPSNKTLKIKNWPPLNCNILPQQNQFGLSKASINVDPQMCEPNHLQFTTKITPGEKKIETKPKEFFSPEGILNYLKIKKCSAKDVLADFSLMFYLFRHLRIKSRQSNLHKIKAILNLIEAKNIDTSTFKLYKTEFDQLRYAHLQEFHAKAYVVKDDIKLSSNPIVVIENITDFAKEQMLFMRKKSRPITNDNFAYLKKKSLLAQNYSSDHVRTLTSDGYKEFRKIVMKRNGAKVWFQLKFSVLPPGTQVFIKDFRNPAFGWEKGTVKQTKGPFRFLIKLDRGVEKWCVPDQIRPLSKKPSSLKTDLRPQKRSVKPKQLLDL